MKASEAMRRIIEDQAKIPGKCCLVIPLDKVLTTKEHKLAFVTFEDLEKSLIDVGE